MTSGIEGRFELVWRASRSNDGGRSKPSINVQRSKDLDEDNTTAGEADKPDRADQPSSKAKCLSNNNNYDAAGAVMAIA